MAWNFSATGNDANRVRLNQKTHNRYRSEGMAGILN
jgi:hypothetical protein